jgi:hypothetical protein
MCCEECLDSFELVATILATNSVHALAQQVLRREPSREEVDFRYLRMLAREPLPD